jgi:hypothetical protein
VKRHSLRKIEVPHDTWLDLMRGFGAVSVQRPGEEPVDLTAMGEGPDPECN